MSGTANNGTRRGLVGVVGSLRSGSVNRVVAQAAVDAVEGLALHDIRDVPFYDGDLEEAGTPAAVSALHDAVGAASGVVFFSPEYNGSFPAVTKNVFDWLTRPPRTFEGVAVTMVVASPGPRAGRGVRHHFTSMMERQPVRGYETLGLGSYRERLDRSGALGADSVEELRRFLEGFASFAAAEAG